VLRYLRATQPTRQPTRQVVLRSLRVCVPIDRVAEVAAVVGCGGRARAVAAGFEQDTSGWRCAAFRML
jgi:hypothetical protein